MRATRTCVSWSAHLRRVSGVDVAGSTWQTASADLCRSAITALAPGADHSSEEATMSLGAYDGAHSVLKPQAAAVASGTVASSRQGRGMGAWVLGVVGPIDAPMGACAISCEREQFRI